MPLMWLLSPPTCTHTHTHTQSQDSGNKPTKLVSLVTGVKRNQDKQEDTHRHQQQSMVSRSCTHTPLTHSHTPNTLTHTPHTSLTYTLTHLTHPSHSHTHTSSSVPYLTELFMVTSTSVESSMRRYCYRNVLTVSSLSRRATFLKGLIILYCLYCVCAIQL